MIPPPSPAARLSCWLAAGISLVTAGLRAQVGVTTPQPTIITSDHFEMTSDGVQSHSVFRDRVRLTGTNLEITCDRLEVFGEETPEEGEPGGRLRPMRTRRILATGNVFIAQAGRNATADQVEVLPLEDVIILTGNPAVVTDTQGTAEGERIIYRRGESRFEIENARMTLRPLTNLGFPQEPEAKKSDELQPGEPGPGSNP